MRALLGFTLIVALLSSTSGMASDQATPAPADIPGNIEPVLVRVNDQGKITDVLPAYPLSHGLMRVLRANLDGMIHKPATDKDGKPIPSQFIIKMALQSEQRTTGDYDAHFSYVSASAVPPGPWYWAHDANGRLVLASQDSMNNNSAWDAAAGTMNSMPTPSNTLPSHGGGGRSH